MENVLTACQLSAGSEEDKLGQTLLGTRPDTPRPAHARRLTYDATSKNRSLTEDANIPPVTNKNRATPESILRAEIKTRNEQATVQQENKLSEEQTPKNTN